MPRSPSPPKPLHPQTGLPEGEAGPVNPRGSLPETRRQPNDSWQEAGRDCLTTTFRRLEVLASASIDVGELLKIAKEVGDAVGVAEEMEK